MPCCACRTKFPTLKCLIVTWSVVDELLQVSRNQRTKLSTPSMEAVKIRDVLLLWCIFIHDVDQFESSRNGGWYRELLPECVGSLWPHSTLQSNMQMLGFWCDHQQPFASVHQHSPDGKPSSLTRKQAAGFSRLADWLTPFLVDDQSGFRPHYYHTPEGKGNNVENKLINACGNE